MILKVAPPQHSSQDRDYFLSCTDKESITHNREKLPNAYTPEAWDAIKVDVMEFLLKQKFDPEVNPDNALRLHGTGNKYLEETNWWGDKFWGKDLKGDGLNTLGVLIMEIRSGHTNPKYLADSNTVQ